MSDSNVTQWLAEVRSLQHQVKMLQQEREEAYNSANNWRKLYESEAQQRRKDDAAHRSKLEKLQQTSPNSSPNVSSTHPAEFLHGSSHPLEAELEAEIVTIKGIQSVQMLQAQLIAAKKQCHQLKQKLEAEQAEHEQTRESLTAALGDAVDLLAKERLEAKN